MAHPIVRPFASRLAGDFNRIYESFGRFTFVSTEYRIHEATCGERWQVARSASAFG